MKLVRIDDLIECYEAILLDAYGVLVDSVGALPGAAALIDHLNAIRKPYYLVSNTAAHLAETAAARFQRFGLNIAAERIITSGSLLAGYFASQGLVGLGCAVLGPDDSLAYVRQAGGIPTVADGDWEVLVVCDQAGYPFLETLDAVLCRLFRRIDSGQPVTLVLPNPDLIYPRPGGFGFTSGAAALLIEAALETRYPARGDLRFVTLGKPEPALFEEAIRRSGTRKLVMIGDQLDTDVRGAHGCGIDAALVSGGVVGTAGASWSTDGSPDYLLESIEPGVLRST